jgi:hypothetical protein
MEGGWQASMIPDADGDFYFEVGGQKLDGQALFAMGMMLADWVPSQVSPKMAEHIAKERAFGIAAVKTMLGLNEPGDFPVGTPGTPPSP